MSTSTLEQPLLRVVVHEGEGAAPLEATQRADLIAGLLDEGYPVTHTAGRGSVSAADDAPTLVMGRFGGTAPQVQSRGGDAVDVTDLDAISVSDAVARVADMRSRTASAEPGAWTPWFPVIDYDRCTNCMQCLSFCLFGVYGVSDDSQIQVQNNDKCKTNCPACSRVCPEAAIMFPKYKNGPVNGAEVTEEDLSREQMKVDISSLLGGDVYEALRSRSDRAKERFARERDEKVALQERRKCLVDLQRDLDIPPEVLMSLPSQDEIRQRADEAKTRGAEARRRAEESVARRLRDRDGLDPAGGAAS